MKALARLVVSSAAQQASPAFASSLFNHGVGKDHRGVPIELDSKIRDEILDLGSGLRRLRLQQCGAGAPSRQPSEQRQPHQLICWVIRSLEHLLSGVLDVLDIDINGRAVLESGSYKRNEIIHGVFAVVSAQ